MKEVNETKGYEIMAKLSSQFRTYSSGEVIRITLEELDVSTNHLLSVIQRMTIVHEDDFGTMVRFTGDVVSFLKIVESLKLNCYGLTITEVANKSSDKITEVIKQTILNQVEGIDVSVRYRGPTVGDPSRTPRTISGENNDLILVDVE